MPANFPASCDIDDSSQLPCCWLDGRRQRFDQAGAIVADDGEG